MATANTFLRTRFVPAYNQRFGIPAAELSTAFVPWSGSNLAALLCVQDDRVVANNNTVRYQGLTLQIPPDRHQFHYVKVTVRVHTYPDGPLAVFHGPRCLARHHADGRLGDTGAAPSPPTRRSTRRAIVPPRPIVREIFSVRSRVSAQKGTIGQMTYYIHRTT
ncbi:MAG: hypothetical protein OEY86_05630 [Nitrospira sp.]|nr:hypothetical protein [Nitrospira sp.]